MFKIQSLEPGITHLEKTCVNFREHKKAKRSNFKNIQ